MNFLDMWLYIVKNKLTVAFTLLVLAVPGFSQQTPLFTQVSSIPTSFNPGAVGSGDQFRTRLIHRQQWSKLEGAPITSGIMGDLSLANNTVGIGFNSFRDVIGINQQLATNLSASYRIRGNRFHTQFGINAGVLSIRNNWSEIQPITGGDPAFSGGDERINLAAFGAGVYVFSKKSFFGLSVPNIPEHTLNANNQGVEAKLKRHYYAHAGFLIIVSEQLKLKPAMLLKYVQGAPLQTDINIRAIIKDKIAFGTGFHSGNGLNLVTQIYLNESWDFGYSYDITLNGLRSSQNGSHEILIGFRYHSNQRIIHSPRYF